MRKEYIGSLNIRELLEKQDAEKKKFAKEREEKEKALQKAIQTEEDKLKAEQKAEVLNCDVCGKVCKSVAGKVSHMRSHDK